MQYTKRQKNRGAYYTLESNWGIRTLSSISQIRRCPTQYYMKTLIEPFMRIEHPPNAYQQITQKWSSWSLVQSKFICLPVGEPLTYFILNVAWIGDKDDFQKIRYQPQPAECPGADGNQLLPSTKSIYFTECNGDLSPYQGLIIWLSRLDATIRSLIQVCESLLYSRNQPGGQRDTGTN